MIHAIDCPDCKGKGCILVELETLCCTRCFGSGYSQPRVGEQMVLFDLSAYDGGPPE